MLPAKKAPALPSNSGTPYNNAILTLIYPLYISLFRITGMQHLVEGTLSRIENNLLWVKSVRDAVFAWWMNAIVLVIVVGSFAYFLYSSYGTAVPEELQSIPFQPRLWNNGVRNVPTTEYGQLPKTETGDGVSGFASGGGANSFW